jgi:hypothetical protein
LASELVQLREQNTLAEEAIEQRDRETLQLREEVQKWASAAEYLQNLLLKCTSRIDETVSLLEILKRELRAPGDLMGMPLR